MLAKLFFVLMAFTTSASAQFSAELRREISSDEPPQVEAFTQPGPYQYDQGNFDAGWGAGSNEVVGIHRYVAEGGADTLTSISVKWRQPMTVGQAAKIAVWQDIGTGIRGARLVHLENVTVQSVGNASFNVYSLSRPVPVSGTFYIGFSLITGPGNFGLAYQISTNVPAGTVFLTGGLPMNFSNLDAQGITDVGVSSPGYFIPRANGARTGFTYQGKLEQNGQPAEGSYDFVMRVLAGESGPQILADYSIVAVPVVNGLFSVRVPIDAATLANTNVDPFLQILVRPTGGFSYTTLQPRQRISQAPSALVAHVAEQARSLAPFSTAPSPLLISAGDWGLGSNAYTPGSSLILNNSGSGYVNMLSPNGSETGVLFGTPGGGAANGGVIFNNPAAPNGLQIRTGGNATRMTIASDGFVGIGRATAVTGADKFSIESGASAGSYGGMYITTQTGGWPFYGYSVPGASGCWTFLNGQTGNWHLFNNGLQLSVSTSGLVGIGTAPSANGFRLELPNLAGPAGQGRANAWVTYSSREFKDNIQTLADPVSTLRKLRGVSFDWKAPLADGSRQHDIGFIAEEVGAVLPELVTRTGDGKATGLDYGRVVPVTVEAIKQQQTRLEALEAENAKLKARLERLERLLPQ